MKKVLVIIGHPIADSFSHAIANAYVASATQSGATVEVIDLARSNIAELPVDRAVLKVNGIDDTARLGSELHEFALKVQRADHLVFVYPVWWGTYPAVLKVFFDRVFLAGFVFKNKSGPSWDKFLTGKTARIFVTMDAPKWFDRVWYRGASLASLKRAILWYCGVKTVGATVFDRLRFSDAEKRAAWLNRTAVLASRDAR